MICFAEGRSWYPLVSSTHPRTDAWGPSPRVWAALGRLFGSWPACTSPSTLLSCCEDHTLQLASTPDRAVPSRRDVSGLYTFSGWPTVRPAWWLVNLQKNHWKITLRAKSSKFWGRSLFCHSFRSPALTAITWQRNVTCRVSTHRLANGLVLVWMCRPMHPNVLVCVVLCISQK